MQGKPIFSLAVLMLIAVPTFAADPPSSDEHPENTSVKGSHRLEVTLPDRVLLWDAELNFSSDLDNFYYHYVRRITENGELVREKEWAETIKRDFQ